MFGEFWVLGEFAFPRVGFGFGCLVFDLFVCLVVICCLMFLDFVFTSLTVLVGVVMFGLI